MKITELKYNEGVFKYYNPNKNPILTKSNPQSNHTHHNCLC